MDLHCRRCGRTRVDRSAARGRGGLPRRRARSLHSRSNAPAFVGQTYGPSCRVSHRRPDRERFDAGALGRGFRRRDVVKNFLIFAVVALVLIGKQRRDALLASITGAISGSPARSGSTDPPTAAAPTTHSRRRGSFSGIGIRRRRKRSAVVARRARLLIPSDHPATADKHIAGRAGRATAEAAARSFTTWVEDRANEHG